jgi:hypothetical protein
MRPFTLAAVALLGSGCLVTSVDNGPVGSLDLGWSFVRTRHDGTTVPPYSCAVAGVDNVVLSVAGFDLAAPCADAQGDGGLFSSIPAGSQTIVVTGRRGGVALYRSQFNVTVLADQTTSRSLQVLGIPDELDVYALFRDAGGANVGWSTCAQAGVATLGYRLVDWADTTVASGTVACTDPAGLSFAGAGAGSLDRDNYAIRLQGFPAASSTETFDSATTAVSPTCSGQAFDHYGFDVGVAAKDVTLYDVSSNVTVCP